MTYQDWGWSDDDWLYENTGYSTMYPMLPTVSVPRGGIRWPTNDERTQMRKTEDILAEAENLRQQAERLEQIAEERGKYDTDPFKNGTVLKIDMKYRTGNRSYSYAAIKIGGRFYLTGKMGGVLAPLTQGKTWDEFVSWLAQGDATVWQARSLQQVL